MTSIRELARAIRDVGVEGCEVLLVYSDLAYLGPLTGISDRNTYLAAIWDCLREVTGSQTTIAMTTASTYLCETGADFTLENSPCDRGVLNEYMRKLPETRRSLHPFVSYSAHGPLAEKLTAHISKTGYGPESPMERIVAARSRALNIGIPARYTPSLVHHAEQLIGVPYRYYKEFPNRVFAGGEYVGTDYLLYVRYLDADIEKDQKVRLFRHFAERGHKVSSTILPVGCKVETYEVRELFETCIAMLRDDPYGLLTHPPTKRPYRR